jgi:membrane-associated phospholipid phosphatase
MFLLGVWFFSWLKERPQILVALLFGAGWLLICSSRIALGVHSVSDVLGGILLGTAIGVVAVSFAPQVFHYFSIKRSSFK